MLFRTTTALWEPEFQIGQLNSKGIFLLGYWDEVMEFCRSIRKNRQAVRGALAQCWQIAHLFEQFRHGPGRMIDLRAGT